MHARSSSRGSSAGAPTSEKELQRHALALLRARGWRCYHTFDSRRSEPGFPDIIAIRGKALVAIECKTIVGKVTAAQAEWLRAFGTVRVVDAIVLRPASDFGELARYLEEVEGRT